MLKKTFPTGVYSNEATFNKAKVPAAPSNLTTQDVVHITAGIQSSPTLNGPWATQVEIQTSIQKQVPNEMEFYRSYVTINK